MTVNRILRRLLLPLIVCVTTFSIHGRDLQRVDINGTQCIRCEVQKGENIYGIAREFGVSPSVIIRFNPSAADGLRKGMRLYIPVKEIEDGKQTDSQNVATVVEEDVSSSPTVDGNEEPSRKYTVTKGESLYGISRLTGISMEKIIAMNPAVANGVKAGDILVLPAPETTAANNIVSIPAPVQSPVRYGMNPSGTEYTDDYSLAPSEQRISEKYTAPAAESVPEYHVAVVLPFMLDTVLTKTSQLYTEFYKGILLAADSMSRSGEMKITIHAYDSRDDNETVDSIASLIEMASMNIIVGPDSESQLESLARTGAPVLNIFNARSNLYLNFNNVLQANIPHEAMYDKAVEAFMLTYRDYTPVFLARIDGAAEKAPFVTRLKERLDADSIVYGSVTFKNLLTERDMDSIPQGNVVFVPVSGARTEFAKISEAIHRLKKERLEDKVSIWGYPDWITFRGDYYTRLGELDAVIYSRFYADRDDVMTQKVMHQFEQIYGQPMLDAAPIQGLLGYDTAMYILQTLKSNDGRFVEYPGDFDGLQSVFDFEPHESESIFNKAIIIVSFSTEGPLKQIMR